MTFGDTYIKNYHNSENKIIFQSKGLATAVKNSTSVNAIINQNLCMHNTRKMQEDAASIFEKTLQIKP